MFLVVFSIDMSHHVTIYWYALNLLESWSSCDTLKLFVQNLFQQVVVWSRSCKASWAREAILHRDWNSEQSRGVFLQKSKAVEFFGQVVISGSIALPHRGRSFEEIPRRVRIHPEFPPCSARGIKKDTTFLGHCSSAVVNVCHLCHLFRKFATFHKTQW